MTIAGLTGPVVIAVSGHNLRADMSPAERATIAERWRDLAVGLLDAARLDRREGDLAAAEDREAAAADWAEAADLLEWGAW